VTLAVGFERAEPRPARLTATTTTRIRWPTSRARNVNLRFFAPETIRHARPAALHVCHA